MQVRIISIAAVFSGGKKNKVTSSIAASPFSSHVLQQPMLFPERQDPEALSPELSIFKKDCSPTKSCFKAFSFHTQAIIMNVMQTVRNKVILDSLSWEWAREKKSHVRSFESLVLRVTSQS